MPAASVLAPLLCALTLCGSPPSASASNLKTRVWDFFQECTVCTDGEVDLSPQSSSGKTASNASDCGWRNLFYNRYRYYDPAVGRYISPDPIGLGGGINFYNYGRNTVGWVDPYGLTDDCPSKGEKGEIIKGGQVYRGGSATPANLTPRPGRDTEGLKRGLSTFDTPEKAAKPGEKYQVIDVSKLGPELEAFKTPDGHVSIRPSNDANNVKLNQWASTRGADPPSPLTTAVQDSIVGSGKRPKK
jgi:RHS repeat-associated protein